jgi:hypothetical protein
VGLPLHYCQSIKEGRLCNPSGATKCIDVTLDISRATGSPAKLFFAFTPDELMKDDGGGLDRDG